ncbi:hypothetical protein [Chitinophaga arvensicola]|uniref:Uncharacterized protein n=1 Tax=Chitinophaga arvensicola TaxID=29529 RepID=A0A1I0SC32_9BACT|nr:hypothetical protein [Chitinophaga arvensicola]SEW53124.1 hypothetical protein SAMN04488122_5346 [Chitinophaga arvensicola]
MRKFPQIFTILCVLTISCFSSLTTKAQIITGPTSVYPGNIGIYELSPHIASNVYVSWCVSWTNNAPDGQIISAPVNTCLEGYGYNTCYVTWSNNLNRASLRVDFPRGGTSITNYTLYITKKTGFNGEDSLVVETANGEKSPITLRQKKAFNYLSFNN